MTAFYLLLWQLGLLLLPIPVDSISGLTVWNVVLAGLALLRIILCFFPQNDWKNGAMGLRCGILRNLPFLLMGILTAAFWGIHASGLPLLQWVWAAIAVSFACYIPVVIGAQKHPALGMLMLPKTCAYIWMLVLCALSV